MSKVIVHKFIRTKNRIYQVESEFLDNEGKWIGYNIVGNDMAIILRAQVINQADTIEELCDGYYLDFGGAFNVNFVYGKNELNYLKRQYSKNIKCGEIVKIKGFIKIDKGLIFVAESDEKGELELI